MPVSMNATVGGQTGPAKTLTSIPITGITSLAIDVAKAVMTIHYNNGTGQKKLELDFVLTTTFTDSIVSLLNTVVVSGS